MSLRNRVLAILVATFLWAPAGHAQRQLSGTEILRFQRYLEQASRGAPVPRCDPDGAMAALPDCSSLAENTCQLVRNDAKAVRSSSFARKVLPRERVGKLLSGPGRADLEALAASEKRLPEDLRGKAGPVLAALRGFLAKDSRTRVSNHEEDEILERWFELVADTAAKRTERARHQAGGIQPSGPIIEGELELVSAERMELDDEITRAKYEENQNWKRVRKVFVEAKADVLAVIDGLEISDEVKTRMRTKLQSVTLTLPFTDPRKLGMDRECATVMENALYVPEFNALTLCAGYFNTYQSEATLFAVIAHEISHSIDPINLMRGEFEASPMGRAMMKLSLSKGPAFSCEEWEKLRKDVFVAPQMVSVPSHPYRRLTDCLAPPVEELEPFDLARLTAVARRRAASWIDGAATSAQFTTLVRPDDFANGKKIPNEAYMRADRLAALKNGGIDPRRRSATRAVPEIFLQELSCGHVTDGARTVGYAEANEEQRRGLFRNAIKTARDVEQSVLVNWYATCGRECDDLVVEGLSRNSVEAFADWMSTQALPRFLSREPLLARRRELVGLAPADLCAHSRSEEEEPDLQAIQKDYSFESHPIDRLRRLSLFTPAVADSVKCRLEQEIMIGPAGCGF